MLWRKRRTQLGLTFFFLYFGLLSAISLRDITWLIAHGYTILPELPVRFFSGAATESGAARDQAPRSNFWSESLVTFEHLAGIEAGYGFFAPNVPDSYKLVFELQTPDGRLEYDLPGTESAETTLRVASLLDQLGGTESEVFQAVSLKLLAHSVWQRHPAATTVRAIVGSLRLPSPKEYRGGQRPSHQFLYAYEFTRSDLVP